jgi:hypothetical protein
MRVDPIGTVEQRKRDGLKKFKQTLAIIICLILTYFFAFKIVFF